MRVDTELSGVSAVEARRQLPYVPIATVHTVCMAVLLAVLFYGAVHPTLLASLLPYELGYLLLVYALLTGWVLLAPGVHAAVPMSPVAARMMRRALPMALIGQILAILAHIYHLYSDVQMALLLTILAYTLEILLLLACAALYMPAPPTI